MKLNQNLEGKTVCICDYSTLIIIEYWINCFLSDHSLPCYQNKSNSSMIRHGNVEWTRPAGITVVAHASHYSAQKVSFVAFGFPHNHTTWPVRWSFGFHRGKRNCTKGREYSFILCLSQSSYSNVSIGRVCLLKTVDTYVTRITPRE